MALPLLVMPGGPSSDYVFVFCFCGQVIEPGPLRMQGKNSTTKPHPHPSGCFFCFKFEFRRDRHNIVFPVFADASCWLAPVGCCLFWDQPCLAVLGGAEDITHSKHKVVLSWRTRISSWVYSISESGKSSVPNLISDLEPGPRNSYWPNHRDSGKTMNALAEQYACSWL